MSAPAIPQNDLYQRVAAHIRQAAKPVTAAALLDKFTTSKAGEDGVLAAIQSAINAGAVYRWPGRARSKFFWNVPWDQTARAAILAAATRALPKPDLIKAAARRLPGVAAARLEPIVAALLAEKRLSSVPGFKPRSKLLIEPGDSQAYFNAARAFIEEKFRKANLDAAPFFTENSPPRDKLTNTQTAAAALILDAVRSLEPVKGVPVSTLRLRNHLPHLSKEEFDGAALELRKKEQVFLSQHADPYNLSQENKDLLIDGQDGTYYVAIAIR